MAFLPSITILLNISISKRPNNRPNFLLAFSSWRCSTFTLRHTSVTPFVRRCPQGSNTLQHLIQLRFYHTEILDCLEFGQEFTENRINGQFLRVLVVLNERPEFFQSIQLSWKFCKKKLFPFIPFCILIALFIVPPFSHSIQQQFVANTISSLNWFYEHFTVVWQHCNNITLFLCFFLPTNSLPLALTNEQQKGSFGNQIKKKEKIWKVMSSWLYSLRYSTTVYWKQVISS